MEAFDVFSWNIHVTDLLAFPHQYQADPPAGIQLFEGSLMISVIKLPWTSSICGTELHLSFVSSFLVYSASPCLL